MSRLFFARPGQRAGKLMLRMAAASLAAVAAMLPISCATTGVAPAPPAAFSGAERPAAGEEVRAVWVVRHSLSSPAAARAVVEEAYGSGFNTLIVQVRGRGDALYRSTLEPRPEFLTGQPRFDALQVVVEEARARGMAVHAWVNAYIVWGPVDPPRDPGHLVNAHPEWLAVPRALGRELYEVDPRDPEYVRRLIAHRWLTSMWWKGCMRAPPTLGCRSGCLRCGTIWRPATIWMVSTTTTFASPIPGSTTRAARWNGSRRG